MIDMLFIDSSAIVKYYSKEQGWEGVIEYMGESATLQYALVELSNGLLEKVRKNELPKELAMELIDAYARSAYLVDQNKYLSAAFKIALENKLSFYDSLFVAVALQNGYDLVTADRKQADISEKLGINTIRC
jgi:predicted nucleic acid-binding protein